MSDLHLFQFKLIGFLLEWMIRPMILTQTNHFIEWLLVHTFKIPFRKKLSQFCNMDRRRIFQIFKLSFTLVNNFVFKSFFLSSEVFYKQSRENKLLLQHFAEKSPLLLLLLLSHFSRVQLCVTP